MWGALIKAIEKKKENVANSFNQMAQNQAAFSSSNTNFSPTMATQPQAQNNNTTQPQSNFSLSGLVGQHFGNNNGYQPTAIGNEIGKQAPSGSVLYEELMRR